MKLLDMVLCGCARVAPHAATGITAVPRSWCEANGVDYIFGLAEKPPLKTKVQEAADAVRTERAEEKRLCDPRLYRDDVRPHR